MSDLNTRPSWFLAIHPISASSSLPICFPGDSIELRPWLSASTHTCLGEGSAAAWLSSALNTLGCQTHQCFSSLRKLPMSILVMSHGEYRGKVEHEQYIGWKLKADRLVGLNIKTSLRT